MARPAAKKDSRFDRAIRQASNRIVKETLAELPANMSLGELVKEFDRSKYGVQLRELSLREFAESLGGAVGTGSPRTMAASPAEPAEARGRKTFKTRTLKGRVAYDAAISAALTKRGTMNAETIGSVVGGESDQIRKCMKRLMDLGQVRKTGQKRSTEYHWKG
ncbi:MAG: hypothetical protein V3W41_03560 [Planctomycetota bacterium]